MKQRGFTLIEIIIALAVFAIIASFTSYILAQSFNVDKRLKTQRVQQHRIELALILLRRETQQIINRPVRGNEQSLIPAFIAHANTLEFTRNGNVNPNAVAQRSTLKRVAYLCYGKKLIRRTWDLLDSPDRRQFRSQVLLDQVKSCGFTYMDVKHQAHTEWKIVAGDRKDQISPLPTSIICHLNLENLGKVEIVLPLPTGFYA
ncbi:MAG: type II secretion system minor pseudopilin GspJ [Gammaproteobacteria bacterium]